MKVEEYISDAVLDSIVIEDQLILDLYRTKEFKRLSRLNHLGLTSFLYPAATQTRLCHSLGVYELARRALIVIDKQLPNLNEKTKLAIKAAALLHDLGHGPMSHLFEMISPIKHEILSIRIIASEMTEVGQVLKKYPQTIRTQIIEILEGRHQQPWINQLISSQIDVDRLDYLIRDTYQIGKMNGLIDWAWLLRNIRIIDNQLTFNQKALATVETIILARYHMNQKVYKHPKAKAFSMLYKWFFNRLHYLFINNKLKLDSSLLSYLFGEDIPLEQFFLMDDSFFYQLIKDVLLFENDEIILKIATALLNQKLPKIYYDEQTINHLEKSALKENRKYTWEIIDYKVAFQDYFNKIESQALIYTTDQKVERISNFSTIFSEVATKKSKKYLGVELQ